MLSTSFELLASNIGANGCTEYHFSLCLCKSMLWKIHDKNSDTDFARPAILLSNALLSLVRSPLFFLINSNNVWRKSAITGNRFVNVFTVHSFSRKFPLGISRYLIRLLYMTPNARYLMPFFQSVVEQELCSWNANINHISSENLFRSIAKAKVKGFKKNQHFLVTVIASHFTSYS